MNFQKRIEQEKEDVTVSLIQYGVKRGIETSVTCEMSCDIRSRCTEREHRTDEELFQWL